MRAAQIGLCVLLLVLTQGCGQLPNLPRDMVALAANAKPDQRLEFDIEIEILGDQILQFKGDVRCEHHSTIQGGQYSTKNSTVDINQYGKRWILSGLNCYPIVLPKYQPSYTVFQLLDDTLAKTYFVTAGGGAELKRNVIKWREDNSRESRNVVSPVFSYGPFIFERLYLRTVPEVLNKAKTPVLILALSESYAEPCARMPEYKQPAVLRMNREELKGLVQSENVGRTEQAFLHYDRTNNGWKIPDRPDSLPPFDASTRHGWDQAALDVFAACFKVSSAGSSIVLFKYGMQSQWIYVPAERALVRVAQMSSGWFTEYKRGNTARMNWL